MMRFRLIFYFLFILLLSFSTYAQLPLVEGFQSSEAGIVGRNIMRSPIRSGPVSPPGFEMPKPQTIAISPEAEKYSFVLKKIVFEGNQSIRTETLEKIFQPFFNKTITVGKLQKLVNEVTNLYQKEGYFLSKAFLPPQEIANGVVKIRVVEGYISEIKVQGLKREQLIHFVEQYGERIKADHPIQLKTLERYLLILNDLSGYTVKSVIEPDPTTLLGSRLTLAVELKHLEASVMHDNYQTPYLGPNETSANGSLNSLLIPGGSLFARGLTSDTGHKLFYNELRYSQAVGTEGLILSLDAYGTKTNPQFVLAPLEIFGTSNDFNGSVSYPVIRSRNRNLSLQAQYDYMTNGSTALGEQLFFDRIQDLTLTANYSDVIAKGEDSLMLGIDQGLSNLGHAPFHSRLGAVGNFFKLIGYASRTQYLNELFSLYAFITGQYANRVLPSSETFTFGGPYLGRGYDWAQFIGDNGVAGKAEFRININHNLPFLKQAQYFVFYDVGTLSSLIPQVESVSGASTGVGVRSAVMDHVNFEGFFGKPLTAPNASQVLKGNSGHALLGFFQVTAYL